MLRILALAMLLTTAVHALPQRLPRFSWDTPPLYVCFVEKSHQCLSRLFRKRRERVCVWNGRRVRERERESVCVCGILREKERERERKRESIAHYHLLFLSLSHTHTHTHTHFIISSLLLTSDSYDTLLSENALSPSLPLPPFDTPLPPFFLSFWTQTDSHVQRHR